MESVTKHDTSSLKLQDPRLLLLHAIQHRPGNRLEGEAPAENMQSGAPSCLIDMLIARSVCKHACSFIRTKRFKEELCYRPKPQSEPVIKLRRAYSFSLRQ